MKKEHIASRLAEYAKSDVVRLHMPGHKGKGKGEFSSIYGYDITELSFSDNLAKPEGIIANAQNDIANILGAKKSYILTGGSTLGIFVMVYAVRNLGKKLIVQRTSHKSVFNALELLGIEPIILADEIKDGLITGNFLNDELFDCADNDVIGALLTSPDYFGRALDLKSISLRLAKNNKLLLIDGAHGGHFAFENREIYAGSYADIWVDGAHKTLQTLTQGAVLNLNNLSLISEVEKGLSIFSTTSPNYLIMASVESGVKRYAKNKKKLIKSFLSAKQLLVNELISLSFSILKCDDVLKLTLKTPRDISGEKVGKLFEKKGIFAELVSEDYILFMLSYDFNKNQAVRIVNALKSVKANKIKNKERGANSCLPARKTSYLSARSYCAEEVDLKEALGKICAENVGVFPPCYPLITAGEVYSEEIINQLYVNNTFGINSGKVKVVKE